MPEAIITLPDGTRGRIRANDMATLRLEAQKLATPQAARVLADIDPDTQLPPVPGTPEFAAETARGSGNRPGQAVTLPFGMGQFSVGGRAGDVSRELSSVPPETSFPIFFGTLGSIASGPVMTANAVRTATAPMLSNLSFPVRQLARPFVNTIRRFGAPTAAAGAGGGFGAAAAESENPDATAESIARAGAEGAVEMGAAELAGLGITSAASRLIAPGLTRLDPLKKLRGQAASFVRRLPSEFRTAARRVAELLPDSANTAARDIADSVRNAGSQASGVIKGLVAEDTAGVALRSATRTAQDVARSLGGGPARRFGFEASDVGPGQFIQRVFESGDRATLRRLRDRMSKSAFNEFLNRGLARVIEASMVSSGGKRVLDPDRLMELWRALPNETQALFSPVTRRAVQQLSVHGQALQQIARAAASPAGQEVIEAAITPALVASFGLSGAAPLLLAKSLISPGLLVRYLSRDQLPSEALQVLLGQGVKIESRRQTGLLTEEIE